MHQLGLAKPVLPDDDRDRALGGVALSEAAVGRLALVLAGQEGERVSEFRGGGGGIIGRQTPDTQERGHGYVVPIPLAAPLLVELEDILRGLKKLVNVGHIASSHSPPVRVPPLTQLVTQRL